jgi:nucleoside 2-deoxyribosyltransferase
MGMTKAPEKCHITDMPTEDKPSANDAVEYFVEFNGKKHRFVFHWDHKNSDFVEKNKFILKGLLVNEMFPLPKDDQFLDNQKLEKIIKEAPIPGTPKNKLDNLILYLYENQDYPGKAIDLKEKNDWNLTLNKLYFKDHNEFWFYLNTLKEQGFIVFIDASSAGGNDAIDIKMTYYGLEYVIDIQENGENSNNCFIAMSFSDSALKIRDTIKKAVKESGFEPLLVNELHYESDLTINDSIIKFKKKSKFLIADFTEQKHGVYFEAGFALGLKRPVIYTCSESDFKNTHFDTNHYPHIVYSDFNDLETKLKDKIQAWIE